MTSRRWPPSPRVEDEWDALSNEISEALSSIDGDDGSVISRGSIDQYPVIIPVEDSEIYIPQKRPKTNSISYYNVKRAQTFDPKAVLARTPAPAVPVKRSNSERKPPNKVRFTEPSGDNSQPRGRAGSDPSITNFWYCPWLDANSLKANRISQEVQVPPRYSSELRIPTTSTTTATATNSYQYRSASKAGNTSRRSDSRNRPPPSYRYADDTTDTSSDRRSSWHSNPGALSQYNDIEAAARAKHEWHSDDEINSSYEGTKYRSRKSSGYASEAQALQHYQTSPESYYHPPPMLPLRSAVQFVANPQLPTPRGRDQSRSSSSRRPSSSRTRTIAADDAILRRPSDELSFHLSPCPRQIPTSDFNDWYTIIGLTHLDICPSCMRQIGGSRFRNFFMPSQPKPRDAKVRCSFSQPWARLAWVQTMKLGLSHLELLYQITRSPPDCKPCPGRKSSFQSWYRIIDPDTGRTLSDFNACESCYRNLRLVMPILRDSFKLTTRAKNRTCDLRSESTRFMRYLDLLELAASRTNYTSGPRRSTPDIRSFVRYAKRKSTMYDCQRDHLAAGPWHFIPELPEFTVCEDCYDDVVWPLGNKPVAGLVSRNLKLVCKKGQGRQASCQLYSPRMRTKFREAVKRGDLSYLEKALHKRLDAEATFRQKKRHLLEEVARGYDRDAELRRNAEVWKRHE